MEKRKQNYQPILYDKVLPHDVKVEKAILSCSINYPDSINKILQIIKSAEYFYKNDHKFLWEILCNMNSRGQEIDLVLFSNEVKRRDKNNEYELYISELSSYKASPHSIMEYGMILSELFVKREMYLMAVQIENDATDKLKDPADLIADCEDKIFELSRVFHSEEGAQTTDVFAQAVKNIEKAQNRRKENLQVGVGTGFYELDRITHGWQDSNMIVLAARPSMGKTALAITFANFAAYQLKLNVDMYSLEMSSVEVVDRILSMETDIYSSKIKEGDLKKEEWYRIHEVGGKLENNLYIDDTPGLDISVFKSRAKKRKLENKTDLIIIDYIQLMSDRSKAKSGNREAEISSISRGIKLVAKQLNIPVIALSQMSRAVEARKDKMPVLADLRESGAIEQDADMVMFLYRPDYYGINEDEDGNDITGRANVIIAKHRNGSLGRVALKFIPHLTKFIDI